MSRAQPKTSPTDHYAQLIARAIAKGRPPRWSEDLDLYCDSSPHEIFAAFAAVVRHMPPAGKDEALAIGYLFLLQRLLEHVRYRVDRGYADAVQLIAEFQSHVAEQAEKGTVDGRVLALVGGALHQAKIPASPALSEAVADRSIDATINDEVPADIRVALKAIVDACGHDPFAAVEALTESGHAMPGEVRVALACALAQSGIPEARSVALLFELDQDSAVREAVAGGLAQVAMSLTPTDVRRLIAMRNWRPERERAGVDTGIRKARAAGIDCAQWQAGSVEAIAATTIDGAGTQAFLVILGAGRKKRVASILTKSGIAEAWITEPESRRRVEDTLSAASASAATLAVSRPYLDRMVAHHLALGLDRGEVPPPGLLQLAEAIGGAGWQPARMPFNETISELLAEIPRAMLEPRAINDVLRNSGKRPEFDAFTQSWFEDDPQIAEAVSRARGSRTKLSRYLLQSFIAARRDKWADLILRTALWMREAPPEANLCWRDLAIIAKALADGRDMEEIALMREIALRTIVVFRERGEIRDSFI